MFLNNATDKPSLKSVHAPYPKVKQQGGHNRLQMLVKERENFIAKTKGNRSFPWRVFVVSENDKQLVDCDMVYRLASPSRVRMFPGSNRVRLPGTGGTIGTFTEWTSVPVSITILINIISTSLPNMASNM